MPYLGQRRGPLRHDNDDTVRSRRAGVAVRALCGPGHRRRLAAVGCQAIEVIGQRPELVRSGPGRSVGLGPVRAGAVGGR